MKKIVIFYVFLSLFTANLSFANQADLINEHSLQLEKLEDNSRETNGKLEELNHRIDLLEKKLENLFKDTEYRLNQLENNNSSKNNEFSAKQKQKNSKSANPKELESAEPESEEPDNNQEDIGQIINKNVSSEDISEEFTFALNKLKNGKYKEAKDLFENFVANYKSDALTGNAYYWLGESYYNLKNYEKSALNYLYCIKKFPNSNKANESMLKLSLSLSKLDRKGEACKTLKALKAKQKSLDENLLSAVTKEFKNLKCPVK